MNWSVEQIIAAGGLVTIIGTQIVLIINAIQAKRAAVVAKDTAVQTQAASVEFHVQSNTQAAAIASTVGAPVTVPAPGTTVPSDGG